MPKTKEFTNHPCHFLSLPSAKRFWCRHCMSVFENAITRWRHSQTCRFGVVDNFMKRRELEAKALQNPTKPNPVEARLAESIEINDEAGPSSDAAHEPVATVKRDPVDDSFTCFICHEKFASLEEMRNHVKYPCSNNKVISSADNRHTKTIYIDEFTDRSRPWDPAPQLQQEEVMTTEYIDNTQMHEPVQATVEVTTQEAKAMANSHSKTPEGITPTKIYVNDEGETVIEVENLDLTTEGAELSLAHLLTQLSQQGIVFDKSKTAQMQVQPGEVAQVASSSNMYTTTTTADLSPGLVKEEEDEQPTAEDAANTLAQLAGFRGFRNSSSVCETTSTEEDSARSVQQFEESASYTYDNTVSTTSGEFNIGRGSHQYEYTPSSQTVSSVQPHISIQPVIANSCQGYEDVKIEEQMVHNFPIQFYEDGSTTQTVTYINSQGEQQQQEETVISADMLDGSSRVIIDESTGSMILHQYAVDDGAINPSQQFVKLSNISMEIPQGNATVVAHSSQIVNNSDSNKGQLVDCVPSHINVVTTSASVPVSEQDMHESTALQESVVNTSHHACADSAQLKGITPVSMEGGCSISDSKAEEFAIQTVTLQEIVESDPVPLPSVAHDGGNIVTALNVNTELSGNDTASTDKMVLGEFVPEDQAVQTAVVKPLAVPVPVFVMPASMQLDSSDIRQDPKVG